MIADIVIGRFHPLLVHLPIGFLLLAFLMEMFSRRERYHHLKPAVSFVLGATVLSAVAATFTGWILPKEGAYDEQLVNWHLWSAASFTIGSVLLYFLHKKQSLSTWGKYYLPFFVLNLALLIATGHYGGSLTHGTNYLFEKEPAPTIVVGNVDELVVFKDIIQPILRKKCTSCHNPQKIKGELVMTTAEGLQKGGKTGPLFEAGNSRESLMLQRIHLPKIEKEHMPPEGKAQLTDDEIALITWWIDQGADLEKKAVLFEKDNKVTRILEKYKSPGPGNWKPNVKPATAARVQSAIENGIKIYRVAPESPFLTASMSYDTMVTKKKWKSLRKLAKNIQQLNLAFSRVDDKILSGLSAFVNLEKLELQNTRVSDKTIQSLRKLPRLRSLNIYGTQVTDTGLEAVKSFPALQNLYLWNAAVSDGAVRSFENDKPLVNVHYKIDEDLFGDATLKPPVIVVEEAIFKDSVRVELALNFKNVHIYFTLDGTEPDTLATLYKTPILITKTSLLKAMAYKEGWRQSKVSQKVFTKATYKVADIRLSRPPHEKYKAKGARSLVDFVKGTITFTDGTWLGYEGQHLTTILDLGQKEKISNVVVGALEDTNAYIFFPKQIQVATSANGRQYQQHKALNIPTATSPHPPELQSYLLEFDPTEARYVKVIIKSNLKNPSWHPAPGAPCWIFIDEVMVN